MSRPSVNDYMAALFRPVVDAANLAPEKASQLKTAPLPAGRKISQYKHLAKIKEVGGPPLALPTDSFLYRFEHNEGRFLCIETENLTPEGRRQLDDWAALNQLTPQEGVEEAAVLFLAYHAKGYFRPKSEFLDRKTADNVLDIVDDQYAGHSIYEAQAWYREVTVYLLPQDSAFRTVASFGIAANLIASVAEFRSQLIPVPVANAILQLAQLPNVNPENLFFALTSTHWKYVAVEIYKCIEAAFYLPWARGLRDALGHKMSARSMATHCKSTLRWRENEKESIKALFTLLPEASVKTPDIQAIVTFADLLTENATISAYAERVYRIRNQIVHQFDYEGRVPLVIPETAWQVITLYLCEIVRYLYSTYAADIDYTFEFIGTHADRPKAAEVEAAGVGA